MMNVVEKLISETIKGMIEAKGWKYVKEQEGAYFVDVPKDASEDLLRKMKAFIKGMTNDEKTLKVRRV